MKKYRIHLAYCVIHFSALIAASAQTVSNNEILVTSSSLPLTAEEAFKPVQCITSEDIRNSPESSIPAILEQNSAIHVSERGNPCVQADLSLRGSTYQQILVTLDGVPITDPQTAHHNMNIPLPLSAIGEMTIIPGPVLFAPGALGGVLNISPRQPAHSGGRVLASAGSFQTFTTESTWDLTQAGNAFTLSSLYTDSDGFQDGADYEMASFWTSAFLHNNSSMLRLSAGYLDKDFGAQDFYGAYPSRELTTTTLFDIAPTVSFESGILLRGVFRFRHHEDDFILFRNDPARYRNLHKTDVLTEHLTLQIPDWAAGSSSIGMERQDSSLDSSRLGKHTDHQNSLRFEHKLDTPILTAGAGVRLDDHEEWGTEISPSLGLRSSNTGPLHLRSSIARNIRPPSYTELFYEDPKNKGAASLQPEEAWGGEIGMDLKISRSTSLHVTHFQRFLERGIDWVRPDTNTPWQAMNIGDTITRGEEWELRHESSLLLASIAYRHTQIENEEDFAGESKYALNIAEQETRLHLSTKEWHGITASASGIYRDVPSLQEDYWLVGSMLACRIQNFRFFLNSRNLLNEEYVEIPGIPTAGTSWETGLEWLW